MEKEGKSSDIIEQRKEKLKIWLKNPYNLLLVALLAFTIIMRLHYFVLTANQPTWWDEGDYLAMAKEFAIPYSETPEWWSHFASIRPPLMPLIWAFFIKFNISEPIMRFLTEVVPSILVVLFTYLVGASFFNKKIGLIAGYSMSIYWSMQFYSYRFLTDIPTTLFALMSIYFFWEFYIKKQKPIGLYLGVLFIVCGFLIRFPTALVWASVAIYLLLTKKQKIFKDKHVWFAAIFGLALLFPYFLYVKLTLGSWFPAGTFYLTNNTITYSSFAWFLLGYIPQFLKFVPTLFVVLGLIYSIVLLVLGFDIFLKQKESHSINTEYFLFLIAGVQVLFYVFLFKTGNDRWILLWFPLVFIYMAKGLEFLGSLTKRLSKYIEWIMILIVLLMLSFTFIPQADQLINQKLTSYEEVKETGLWLRENAPANSKVLGASIVQNAYYSHLRTYDFYIGTELQKQITGEIDPQGRPMGTSYETIRNETELECKIVRVRPDYLILHGLEPVFTPDFIYDYPQRHPDLLEPVTSFQNGGQTTAIIYKFKAYPAIDPAKVNCTWVYDRPENISGKPMSIILPERLIIPS